MKYGLLFLAFLPALSAAQTRQPDFDKMIIRSSRHWLDIDYVGDNIIGHRLDIHLPEKGKGPYPVVICIYGSAWFSNSSKANPFHSGIGQALLEGGFAVVSINHRSSGDAKFPAQYHDVKAAIRFVRANAAIFSLDAGFIGMTGWSSGGHLASLAGSNSAIQTLELDGQTVDLDGELGKFTQTSSRVDAVVDWFGPTDFLIMDECGSSFSHDAADSPESSLIGAPIQDHPERASLADPATYMHAGSAPFLIFHGDVDPLVPHCQSEHLKAALDDKKVENELIIIEGGKHGPGVMIPEYYDRMIDFFKSHMK